MQENSRRHKQVANAIRQELVTILRKDLSDPKLEAAGMITISGIDVAEDMRNATVWISFMGKDEKSKVVQGAFTALKSANKFIHRLLIKRIPMKVHPRLIFKYDNMFERAATISQALHEAAEIEKETIATRGPGVDALPPSDTDPEEK